MQEYRCLLTLEGLQAIVGQCLHRLQELQAGETPLSSVLKSGRGGQGSPATGQRKSRGRQALPQVTPLRSEFSPVVLWEQSSTPIPSPNTQSPTTLSSLLICPFIEKINSM